MNMQANHITESITALVNLSKPPLKEEDEYHTVMYWFIKIVIYLY